MFVSVRTRVYLIDDAGRGSFASKLPNGFVFVSIKLWFEIEINLVIGHLGFEGKIHYRKYCFIKSIALVIWLFP